MKAMKLSDMPIAELPKFYYNSSSTDCSMSMDTFFPALQGNENTRVSMSSIIEAIREEFSPGKAVVICKYCGQWGARFCECKKCGAPIE